MKIQENGQWRKINASEIIFEFLLFNIIDNNKKSVSASEIISFLEYADKYIDMDIPDFENEVDLLSNFFSFHYQSGIWMKDGKYCPHFAVNYNSEENMLEVVPTAYFKKTDELFPCEHTNWEFEKRHARIVLLNYYNFDSLNPNYRFGGRTFTIKY